MSDYRLYAIRVFTLKWEESVRFYREAVGLPLSRSDEAIGWARVPGGIDLPGCRALRPRRPGGRGTGRAVRGRFAPFAE